MTKVAILIDGGFFLKRLPKVQSDVDMENATEIKDAIQRLVNSHLDHINQVECAPKSYSLLYRVFYYDSFPYQGKEHYPISRQSVDFAVSKVARSRQKLFQELRSMPNTAVRLGEVRRSGGWTLRSQVLKQLLQKKIKWEDLEDDDFILSLQQKAVDMRVGMDIATLTLKKQVDTLVLVAGDADFVPAAKLARREGARVILDPLWSNIGSDLYEHIDGLRSGFPRPGSPG